MIVNYTEQGWQVITQRAHGLLAAQFAMQWEVAKCPSRWTETIVMIAGHDDAQTELREEDLLTPAGGPVDYAMKVYEADRAQRMLDFAFSRGRYSALLASMHMTFLYRKEHEKPEVQQFLKEQKKLQDKWCHQLNINRKEADSIYGLLEWCDALSLLLCKGDIQPEQRLTEISKGDDDRQYTVCESKDGHLCVSPWPFEADKFEVYLETRCIRQLQFKTPAEFKQCFLDAEVIEKRWTLAKK
ncbi:DUF3891 family protein [Mucilaginibacter sp. RS28]|uniref:DUF3891 family protein n=1 Tax=Mucilaginibacter straminoryzae TaxID=2932774 RepID=A0A9X1X0X7_9SPHI|nr:DUF3891 family protein [Mucilaginibacter straminoryzae]MCJ8208751.1 DUF3891 family protein [Mucilaginibacter straminoryzae]